MTKMMRICPCLFGLLVWLAGCGVDVQKSDRLRDILKPGFEKSLNSIGEVRFRASENLDHKAGLRANNFWFPNDGFQRNDNFFIDAEGLTFQYNSYEVNCFACGAPSVFLPYSGLRNLLHPDANIP
jgi:hypothetical protein